MTLAVNIAQSGSNNVTFRNKIINGACVIDQRNAGASVTIPAGGAYTLDRWQAQASQASKYTVQQSSTAPAGFVSSAKLTSSSAYSLAAGDYFQFQQSIEGFNAADLNWGTANAKSVTLTFWVNASVTGTYGLFFVNNASTRIYSTTYTVSSANTWEQKTITLIGDTSGTWETTNSTGIRVAWILGYGSTYTGATANTWVALSNNFAVNGCVNFLGTSGATFYITGVQLEAGTTASPFEYRQYGTELNLCQRYCYVSSNNGVQYAPLGGLAPCKVVGLVTVNYYFPVTMRATPTLTSSSLSLFGFYDFSFSGNPTTLSIDQANLNYAVVNYSGGSGGTVGTLGRVLANSTTTTLITLSAEL
jgi:hypothetical protein